KGNHPWLLYGLILPSIAGAFLLLVYTIVEPYVEIKIPRILQPTHLPPERLELVVKQEFKKIAVSVDFSASDNRAISYALNEGGPEGEYFLVHIVESAGARMMKAEIYDRETEEDRSFLDRYCKQLEEQGYKATPVLDFGLARNVLPEVAKRLEADLLVMSSHRKGFLHQLIKGTTISQVQRKINIPLIILK
ncbi:MAG TPA: universal stress protein, partial [Bacteroidales bacterium]|nr:universal stress protein [Bacteroidales bacterium]